MMTLPHINMNGTGAEDLLDGYRKAMDAIQAARDAMQATCPNGRDYCQQENGATIYEAARAEHWSRMKRIDEIHAELELLAVHCFRAVRV